MSTPLKTFSLRPPKAPNLLAAPVTYTQQYQEQLNNALRLYFNQIDNFAQPLSSGTGGAYVQFPYGAFHYDKTAVLSAGITSTSTTPIPVVSTAGFASSGAILIGTEIITYTNLTPTAFDGTVTRGAYGTAKSAHVTGDQATSVQGTAAVTATPVYLNTTDYEHGVTIQNASLTSKITFQYAGVYNIQFSAQLGNAGAAPDNVTVWFRKNGVDIDRSAGVCTVPASHGGIDGALITSWNLFVRVIPNDYIELYWSTDSGNSVLKTYPVGTTPVHPASPAIIVTASFVSAL